MPARAMSTSSFPEFVAFYRTHRDRVDFKEKLVFDRLIEDGEPESFEFRVTEYDDMTQLRVRYGPSGMAANTHNLKLDSKRMYLVYHDQNAYDRLEELMESGDLLELDRRLQKCITAVMALADDPVRAELFLTITLVEGRIHAMYVDAFSEMITVEYP